METNHHTLVELFKQLRLTNDADWAELLDQLSLALR